MKIDLQTLSIVVSGVSLIATLTLYSLKQVMPKHASIQAWLWSGTLGTISFGAVLLFGVLGNAAFSIHHALSLTSMYLLYKGAHFLQKDQRPHPRWLDGALIAYALMTAWLLRDQLTARYVAYDMMAAILLALTSHRLWRLSNKGRNEEYTVALAAYGIGTIAFAWHLYAALRGDFVNGADHPYNELLLVIITFIICAWTYGNILIIQRQVQRDMEDKIRVDDLTGILNRRGIHEVLHRLLSTDAPFEVYVIDLNKFKAVNDTYGHLNGDRMLQEYARSLKKATFTKANVARLGGDEFLVVTTDRMNETEIPAECTIYVDGSAVRLAASIGKASYPVDGRTLDSLFEVADRSMYRRKSALKRERTEK